MATTIHNFPSDGSLVARGTGSVADGGSIVTGLAQVDGFVANALTGDVVINFNNQSAGTVNVGVFIAGAASAGARTIYWEAWQNKMV